MTENKIFKDLIHYFISTGVPVIKPEKYNGLMTFSSEIKQGEMILHTQVIFDQAEETVVVSAESLHRVHPENRPAVLELLNTLHFRHIDSASFVLNPETGRVMLKGGIFAVDEVLNKKEFSLFFKKIINDACSFFPLIDKQAHSKK